MKAIALDIETIGRKPYGGTVWIVVVNDGRKVSVYKNPNGLKFSDLPVTLIKALADPVILKVIHNAAFDVPYLNLALGKKIPVNNIWDSMLAEMVIQGVATNKVEERPGEKLTPKQKIALKLYQKHSAALEHTLPRYGFKKGNKELRQNFIDRPKGLAFSKEEIDYAIGDVKYLLELQKAQDYLLTRDQLIEVALLEMQTLERLIEMKIRGIGFDSAAWHKIALQNTSEFKRRLARLPNTVENWNSEKQVKQFFYNRGIGIQSYSEIDKVYAATKDKILGDFIHARELHKSVTSYGVNWFEEGYIDEDGRIRCDVMQIKETGRMSMFNPNLQQLPAKGLHRSAFVPAPGTKFVIGDFSGQEIGIMAAAANEKIWVDAMLRGDDVHSLTASLLYQTEWNGGVEKGCVFPQKCSCSIHKDLRDKAKVLNFMLAYGGGPQKFADKTGLEMLDARIVVRRYKKIIPKLTQWLERNGMMASNTGESYSADPYKRRRVLLGEEDWHIVNQGKNNPIQAAGANMLKLAMISIPKKYYIPLVIHDEIILEVPNSEAKKAAQEMKIVMEQAADYITGIKGLIRVKPRIATNLLK